MDAAAAISPELVLVDPSLREEALASLSDYGWQAFLYRTRVAAARPEGVPLTGESLRRTLRATTVWVVFAFACASAVTLALTLIADSVR